MLLNYLKIAWRNIKRKPIFSVINIAGLAIGLAACIMIGLWVQQQLSYDRFQKNNDHIYRLINHIEFSGSSATTKGVPVPLASFLNRKNPKVEKVIRISRATSKVIDYQNKLYNQKRCITADPGFFKVFSFSIIHGNDDELLKKPGSVVLTKSTAQKYFSDKRAVGQPLKINGQAKTVTGVVVDPPANSSLQFSVVETSQGNESKWQDISQRWYSNPVITYVSLNLNASTKDIESSLSSLVTKEVEKTTGQKKYSYSIILQRLTDIHLRQGNPYTLASGTEGTYSATYVWLFIAVALFILLLASINYMNLATARSTERAREVGIRKTLGAGRWGLAGQFLAEAGLTCLLALLLALVITQLALPPFSGVTGAHLTLGQLAGWKPIVALIGLIALLVVGSSWYPALLLSGFSPRSVFQSEQQGGGSNRLRKGLVVFQFTVAVVLVVATITVYRQLFYMRSASLGFQKDQVLLIKNLDKVNNIGPDQKASDSKRKSHLHTLKSQIQKLSDVKNASLTFAVPSQFYNISPFQGTGAQKDKKQKMSWAFVDADYLPTLDIELAAGRNFSSQRSEEVSVILNQAAANVFFHNPDEAIGKYISGAGGRGKLKVVGVIKNFNYQSLRKKVEPMALRYNNGILRVKELAVKLRVGQIQQGLSQLKQTWKKLVPDVPFNYSFLDQQVAAQYKTQQQTGRIFAGFTILAIIVACLGLFGLTTYATQLRTKEIGIRKVLGASVASIVGLLSKDFLKLVALGFVIAVPVGWYFMHRWLQDFAYKINLSPWIFLLAGGLALVIALATVSWQSVGAALTNPVDSLRNE